MKSFRFNDFELIVPKYTVRFYYQKKKHSSTKVKQFCNTVISKVGNTDYFLVPE